MADYETLIYEVRDGVGWVTLNRPEVHNAFNVQMQKELRDLWRSMRHDDDVRVAVLTGAGDKAFCTGIDRTETMGTPERQGAQPDGEAKTVGSGSTPFHFDDPGDYVGPKSNDLWKPVIAAVNGMACGGAFYMLGEVEFIIAAEHATFFDPHVTYGMTAAFEPIHMLQKMPFHEIMRVSLLGNHERMSAQRAHQIGLVSEVVPGSELRDAAAWCANAIASAPPLAIEGTVRAIWSGLEHSRSQALGLGYAYVGLGTNAESLRQGQELFASGKRIEWRLR
ncbi:MULTISPECIES: enoyl-CoA hydratase/isomerase family protein [Rhabdothermincola]|jgi:enoyl-CoA hydratase/carnithine racemase|uniref:enoyl-CoA hydratase/isomerase family protein n=1 Tax=Rhabdothermincola TaxID=2820403 RepID=UPI001AA06DA5|nr:enoyl-CoA hydratase-related protein [Rhabdothermincola sediminis]